MSTWTPYYLYCKSTNGHLNAILFHRSAYLCNRYKEKSPPLFFCLSIAKWKHEKYGSHGIIVIEIASLTIVHDRKAHIPLFESCGIFFLEDDPFTCTTILNRPDKSNVFKGWLAIWGRRCMLIPKELAIKFALVSDPVAQLFVFPAFYVYSSSLSML